MFDGKNLMITGGTGSFGTAVLRRFFETDVNEIRIFSRDEKKQDDLRTKFSSDRLKCYIGDVRDQKSVLQAMRGVDYVFHAAALKQVPSCEFHPLEAVRTNIMGTDNVLNAAQEAGVERVIVLSTDKAVYPINAMGISKAMAEKVLVARSRMQGENDTVFCATRYGNVMASRGSVIPLFISQIKSGRPLTVTDPNMTRFLMTLDSSVDLVMDAFLNGRQGDIFVQKSPACTVGDLAEAVCRVFNVPNSYHVIGTRHGEKLYESLISREEMARSEDMGRSFRITADSRDLNYSGYIHIGETSVSQFEDYTSHNTYRLSVDEISKLLLTLDFVRESLND